MADAAGKWDAATLSTLASLSKIENEITQLDSAGSKSYSIQDADVASAITEASLDVSDGKGLIEVIGVAETECVFSGFSVKVMESDDDSTFAEYGTGLTIYSKTGTVAADTVLFRYVIPSDFEDYFKPDITIGTSTGTISIYIESKYNNKINIAKEMLGDDLSELLINNGLLNYIDIDADDILDCIYVPADLGLTSDLLTLSLIYRDKARGAEDDSLFWQKSKNYYHEYEESLRKKTRLLVIDTAQDGTNLVYYSRLKYIPQAGR